MIYSSRDYIYILGDKLYRFPHGLVSWDGEWVIIYGDNKFKFRNGFLVCDDIIYYGIES